jgi:hypothetical protein
MPCVIRLTSGDSYDYWAGRNEGDIATMVFGDSFVDEGSVGTGTHDPGPKTHDQWAHTLNGADIDDERRFSTQRMQPTTVCVDADEEAPTRDDVGKKKGESHMTNGFNDDEDKCLCDAWLATSHDCINGAQHKGKVY